MSTATPATNGFIPNTPNAQEFAGTTAATNFLTEPLTAFFQATTHTSSAAAPPSAKRVRYNPPTSSEAPEFITIGTNGPFDNLPKMESVKHLKLREEEGTLLSDEGFKAIRTAYSNLTGLDLSTIKERNNISSDTYSDEESRELVGLVLGFLYRYPNLKSLDISNTDIIYHLDAEIREIGDPDDYFKLETLKAIHYKSGLEMWELFIRFPLLQNIDLSYTNVNYDRLEHTHFKQLHTFKPDWLPISRSGFK